MNYLKHFFLIAATLSLFQNICHAADIVWYRSDKKVIFTMAKDRDRFVLLFAGNPSCVYCQKAMKDFNDATNGLKSIIDANYFTWYVDVTTSKGVTETYPYLQKYTSSYQKKNFPILCLINPDDPEKDFTVYFGYGYRTVKELNDFLLSPPDLFAGQKLKWNKDENVAVRLAKQQNKFIFKYAGKATSPNTKKVINQLNVEPLKKYLDDNFILWFSPEISLSTTTPAKLLPLISILYQEEIKKDFVSLSGYQSVESIEKLLQSYPVSNESMDSEKNKVTVTGNVIEISNHTYNERIKVFSITGQMIGDIEKKNYRIKIDAALFPKGVLVIYSSSGWSSKIIIQ